MLAQLIRAGKIKVEKGFLGIGTQDVAGDVKVVHVERDYPGFLGGVRVGDRVMTFDGKPLKTSAEFNDAVDAITPGTKKGLEVERPIRRRKGEKGEVTETGEKIALEVIIGGFQTTSEVVMS